MQLKSINTLTTSIMLSFTLLLLFTFTTFLEFPSSSQKDSTFFTRTIKSTPSKPDPFQDLFKAFNEWDDQVGCVQFREKHKGVVKNATFLSSSLQEGGFDGGLKCGELKMKHVSVLVKGWTWIPDNLDNLYYCGCGMSCLWTKSDVLADKPDALLFETSTPPLQPFRYLLKTFNEGDDQVNCVQFREKHKGVLENATFLTSFLQEGVSYGGLKCDELKMRHVSLLVKGWTWIPVNLDNLYYCKCGMSCLWTKSSVLVDKSDALLFEISTPPLQRSRGDPLRVYMDLEAGRKRSGYDDIFISYHAKDDVQATYAGALFHNNRNFQLSQFKRNDTLVYWSSSRCLPERNKLARSILSLLPHHSFGKCLNNVGGMDMALTFYPQCIKDSNAAPKWWDHLHCAMSHYKFVLAIENTITESYVTEKLFYALDSGSVPIYFGAPNVWDFVPPNSIIDGSKFGSMQELASYVKAVADDPVAYAEYHAWRRCGVLGNYGKARAVSLDTLPCRLCEAVSRRDGRNAAL